MKIHQKKSKAKAGSRQPSLVVPQRQCAGCKATFCAKRTVDVLTSERYEDFSQINSDRQKQITQA